ncbi:MAG: hypothetical protein C4K58_08355 [Flavobacteriaceae bacterium]|nr:MAG: hypothetical protein C4K58_08355 [Flavobacteriaceae bacterium]
MVFLSVKTQAQLQKGSIYIGLGSGIDATSSQTVKTFENGDPDEKISETFAYRVEPNVSYILADRIQVGARLRYYNKSEKYTSFDTYEKIEGGIPRITKAELKNEGSVSEWSAIVFGRYFVPIRGVKPSNMPFAELRAGIANANINLNRYGAPYPDYTTDFVWERDETYFTAGASIGVAFVVTKNVLVDTSIGMDMQSGSFVNINDKETDRTATNLNIGLGVHLKL